MSDYIRAIVRAGACLIAGASLTTSTPTPQSTAVDWPLHGLTSDEQRFSPLRQIDGRSIAALGLAWWAEFDTDRGLEATPIEVDGVLYTTTSWSKVHAFDARTGKHRWFFDPEVPGQTALHACCDVVNRGPAVWQGKVFVGTLDGRLVALNAGTGKPIWQVRTTDPSQAYTITGAPKVIKGNVIIGNGGAEYGVRGYVSAYDAATGKLRWRFYLTPNPKGDPDHAASDGVFKAFAAATWEPGVWQQAGGGGTAWDSLTYDRKNDLLLIGTGNGGPWDRGVRSAGRGDNLFLSSIVALKPETGHYVWHYQETPGDQWDYTATQHIMLADLPIGGRQRRVVLHAPKNGFFYVLDAKTGRLISADTYVRTDWAERIDLATGRPVESASARYAPGRPSLQRPGPLGGHNWQPMAYNPNTGLVYIPAQQAPFHYATPDTAFEYVPGIGNRGISLRRPRGSPTDSRSVYGELVAWDPVARRARWRRRFDEYWRSGVLATAGGLVFHAVGNDFTAFDAVSGKTLWRYDTAAAAIAPAITYQLDETQYIAIMVGWGGVGGFGLGKGTRKPGRLLVFKLGGAEKAPPFPEVPELPPLDLTTAIASKGNPAAGEERYLTYCQSCHRERSFLPNLNRSAMILDADAFAAVVLDGALVPNGMPSFKAYFDRAKLEDLRAFLLIQARDVSHRPDGVPQH